MTLSPQLKRNIDTAVETWARSVRERLDELEIETEDKHGMALAATVMIQSAPGVTFGPESAAYVAGVVLSALNYAEQQRRRKVQ